MPLNPAAPGWDRFPERRSRLTARQGRLFYVHDTDGSSDPRPGGGLRCA